MPSFCSSWRPIWSALRAYSLGSISGFFTSLRFRLPLSQSSKACAISSFGERNGCASPSPLICVAS